MATVTVSSSRAVMATGFTLKLFGVAAGVGATSGFTLLLSFALLLAGASLMFIGVRNRKVDDDDPTTIGRPGPAVPLGASGIRARRALVYCLRRNLALVGLLLAYSAASLTAAAAEWETNPVLCFCAFALLLLGLALLNVGVVLLVGDDEQEQ